MRIPSSFRAGSLAVLALLTLPGCDLRAGGGDDDAGAATPGSSPRPRYVREYAFLGLREAKPLVVPFTFRAVSESDGIQRDARAWLAHGSSWERFFEESWQSPGTSGVWRILPRGDLRVSAQGANEVEALWYQRGERRLRLQMGQPMSGWVQGNDARFRVLQGRLTLGEEVISGAVLQLLKVDRVRPGNQETDPSDWLFLAGGDSLRLVLAKVAGARDRFGTSFGWTGRAGGERAWEMVEINWSEVRPLQEARRDIPLRWSFRIPEAGVQGEVRALGYDPVLGAQRTGRRAVEVHYTVEGWVEVDGQRSPVQGAARHSQR